MANIKSSKKSIRKIAKLTARNKAEKTRLKTFSKKLKKLQADWLNYMPQEMKI